jgi:hypothetical protein
MMSSAERNLMLAVFFILSVLVINCHATPTGGSKTGGEPYVDIQNLFVPSGWMGDGLYGSKYIYFTESEGNNPHSPPTCTKVTYTFGPKRWAGVYWQNKPNNWGDEPGNNYAGKGYARVSFWARGETGKEVVEFKSGMIKDDAKRYSDSFGESAGRIALTKDWKHYTIDLANSDLKSVIGGFCWVASGDYNSGSSVTFFIDDIVLE